MSALWHSTKAEALVGDGEGRARLNLGLFLLSPMIFTSASHVWAVVASNQIKWPYRRGMRLFAYINSNILLFRETAWAQVMYNGFKIIFPPSHTLSVGAKGVVTNEGGN